MACGMTVAEHKTVDGMTAVRGWRITQALSSAEGRWSRGCWRGVPKPCGVRSPTANFPKPPVFPAIPLISTLNVSIPGSHFP
jgi:hypothetical protein